MTATPTPDPTTGVGWYEVIHPTNATTLLAYVHEDGSVYFPETNDGRTEFAFAAARGNVHRLIRADALDVDEIARVLADWFGPLDGAYTCDCDAERCPVLPCPTAVTVHEAAAAALVEHLTQTGATR